MKKIALALALTAGLSGAARAGGGASVFDLGQSTPAATAVIVTTSAGSFFDIEIGTAAAGDYVQCFDTNTVSGINLSGNGNVANSAPEIATLYVSTTNATTTLHPAVIRKFNNGMSCVASAARRIKILWGN